MAAATATGGGGEPLSPEDHPNAAAAASASEKLSNNNNGRYAYDKDPFQGLVKDSARRTSVNSFAVLIVVSLVYMCVYGVLCWLYWTWLVRFGMMWVWVLILLTSLFDVVAGVLGIAGVVSYEGGVGKIRRSSGAAAADGMSLASVMLVSMSLVLGVAVLFGLPSEDSWGEDWHVGYPNKCYYHRWYNNGSTADSGCEVLRELGVCIWCTFAGFLVRLFVLCVTQWSVWRAKHGEPAAYVLFNDQPVIHTTYYPVAPVASNSYYYTTSSPHVVVSGGMGRQQPYIVHSRVVA